MREARSSTIVVLSGVREAHEAEGPRPDLRMRSFGSLALAQDDKINNDAQDDIMHRHAAQGDKAVATVTRLPQQPRDGGEHRAHAALERVGLGQQRHRQIAV